jgi:hypothetical protein
MEHARGGQVARVPTLAPGAGFEAVVPNPKLKLLEQMREVLRLRHYSIRTETAYCDWIKRFIPFYGIRHTREMGAEEVGGLGEGLETG